MEAFSSLKESSCSVDHRQISDNLIALCRADRDSTLADQRVRRYYLNGGLPLWIDRGGMDSRADTLLAALRENVPAIGFSIKAFCGDGLENDVERIRTLDFAKQGDEGLCMLMARTEYRLTKAYFRYVMGQRFGFVNPLYVYNRIDALRKDTTGRVLSYRRLFDMDIERPDSAFYARLRASVRHDSLGGFLREALPRSPLYGRMLSRLGGSGGARRRQLLCNMDRLRWRLRKPFDRSGRHVVVNIPAYHLYAYGPDTVVEMRVGCGRRDTKTPMLVSEIERMDLNPQWHIPMSIIQNDVARHAGDASYFARRRYVIVERGTGKQVNPSEVTSSMLLGGAYRVSQEGGAGNAMGRIVFRFANSFSVFLHDTSSRGFFSNEQRGVSHGCVRVERPFDLAMFLLGERDEWFWDKLRITMGMEPETDKGKAWVEEHPDNFKLLGSQHIKPRVPLALVYFTLYPGLSGELQAWPDVYGYDEVTWQRLQPFI